MSRFVFLLQLRVAVDCRNRIWVRQDDGRFLLERISRLDFGHTYKIKKLLGFAESGFKQIRNMFGRIGFIWAINIERELCAVR